MKKRTKAVLAVVFAAILVFGSVFGYLMMFYKPNPVINEYTGNNEPSDDPQYSTDSENQTNIAVFSSGVHMYTDEDAEDINAAISHCELTGEGLKLDLSQNTQLENLGVGDIFFLDGDASTPLGEPYIGKIASVTKTDDQTVLLIDEPMVDEVFDVLNFDIEEALTTENISQIAAVEGVTVTEVDSLDGYFTELSDTCDTGHTVTTLASHPDQVDARQLTDFDDSELFIEIELDILEMVGLKEEASNTSKYTEKYDYQEGQRIEVCTTATGKCYHRPTCFYLKRSSATKTLEKAVQEKYNPCKICKPPLLKEDDGTLNFDPKLTLTGKMGLEDIACDIVFDWNILSGKGLENASTSVSGNLKTELELKSELELEFGGRTTTFSCPLQIIKAQCLKEKLFPFLFIGYDFATTVTAHNADELRLKTSAIPITLGVCFYVDASGKVSLSGNVYFNYQREFEYTSEVVRDGQLVREQSFNAGKPKTEAGLSVELTGDADLHAGASAMVYVFNLNPMELALARFGAEAEGKLKIAYSTSTGSTDDAVSLSYYARMYTKLLELRLKLKIAIDLGVVNINPYVDLTLTGWDITLAEWGAKNPTQYNSSQMSCTVVTARDKNSIYYKDLNGALIKETNGYRSTLYSDPFFTICAIDESFIYLLRNSSESSGNHDIYRVSTKDGTNKKIAEGVSNCLMSDERYLYYVSAFDQTTILRMDRATLKEEAFYHDTNNIRYMKAQDGGFYVVTEHEGTLSWFLGSDIYYTLLNESGMVVTQYGKEPSVTNLALSEGSGYYQAAKIISTGYLRSTAQSVYWLSEERSAWQEATGVSGWNPSSQGIFTTVENKSENASAPFSIVLYQAANGERIKVTDVQSNQAFFTLCKSSSGWYFFDETEDSLILYYMDNQFRNKTVIKTFSLSEIPYSLSQCGMTIMDNRIYFYTIPDNSTTTVLYRYDII